MTNQVPNSKRLVLSVLSLFGVYMPNSSGKLFLDRSTYLIRNGTKGEKSMSFTDLLPHLLEHGIID